VVASGGRDAGAIVQADVSAASGVAEVIERVSDAFGGVTSWFTTSAARRLRQAASRCSAMKMAGTHSTANLFRCGCGRSRLHPGCSTVTRARSCTSRRSSDRMPLFEATLAYAAGEGRVDDLQQRARERSRPRGVRVNTATPASRNDAAGD